MGILFFNEEQEAYLLHNARHKGAVGQQKLTEAMEYPEHAKIAWIKRPTVFSPDKRMPSRLTELGFEHLIS